MNDSAQSDSRDIRGMFDGPVIPVTLRLAVPVFIGMAFQLLYNFVDTIFVTLIDRSSTVIFPGVSLVFPVFFMVMALAQGLSVGLSSLIARAIGEQNQEVIDRTADSGLLIAVIMAVICVGCGYLFAAPVIRMLGGTGDVYKYAMQYYMWVLPGMGLIFIGSLFGGIIQGEGLTRPFMISMIISTVLNIILDPLLIFGYGMGVAGAGLATVIAHTVGRFYIIQLFIRKKTRTPIHWSFRRARLAVIREIFRIGIPQSFSMLTMSVASMILNKLVLSLGTVPFNAFALVRRFDQIILIPSFAAGSATITMVGQNFGRNKLDRIRKIFKNNVILTILVVTGLAAVYCSIAPYLFSMFTANTEVLGLSVLQARIVAFSFLGAVVGIVSRSVFQGTGSPLPALILTVVRMGLVVVPLAFFIVRVLDLDVHGVWYAIVIGNLVSACISLGWINLHLRHLKPRSAVV